MKKIFTIAGVAFALSGCATALNHNQVQNMTQSDLVYCAQTGTAYGHDDLNGYCKSRLNAIESAGNLNQAEAALGMQQVNIHNQQVIEQQREDDRENNTLMVIGAICSSRPWGC